MDKKASFKYIITEFQEFLFPKVYERTLNIPETSKIVSIIGSRRVGKTFYFYQLIIDLLKRQIPKDRILYINFEDDRLFPLELQDLNYLLEAYYELYPDNTDKTKYFFFDEIQVVDHWELFLRRLDDKEQVKIFLTGSSSKLLSQEIASTLRGRTLGYFLYPLGFHEFLLFNEISIKKSFMYSNQRYKIKNLFEQYFFYGGFPEVVHTEQLKEEILRNYFEMFVYRDLVERYAIRNTRALKQLAKYLITNIANHFSINRYYKSLTLDNRVSKTTIYEYLSHLGEINLILTIPIFSYSLKVQQVNPIKVYCLDTGLRNVVTFRFSSDIGRLVENVVCLELKRRGKEIFYWKKLHEVDFIVKEPDNNLRAINVSYTNEIPERETEGLLEFKNAYNDQVTELLILTEDLEEDREMIQLKPVWKWLLDWYQ